MIPNQRMTAQHLAKPALAPIALLREFGAMQAQEYEQAKWAVGLRSPGTTEADIETLLADGEILRSHPMRGTHHFVARDDLRWLMALMGPVMIARSANRNRQLELDEKTLARCMMVIGKALAGGNHLTRAELAAALQRAKISTDGQRIAHIMYRAELESLVCSGRRKGKHITFALFDERVPASKAIARDEAIGRLAARYVATRSPATLADFQWWCQLPMADARAGFESVKAPKLKAGAPPKALLLPPYDEYTVSYKDRSSIGTPPSRAKSAKFGEWTMLGPVIVLDGLVCGTWSRKLTDKKLSVTLSPWRKLNARETLEVSKQATRLAAFLGR